MKSMKKILALAAASVLAVSFAACGSSDDSTGEDKNTENRSSAEETTQEAGRDPAGSETGDTSANGSRILIAYFTAAENSGVDAEASASYSEVDGEAKGRMQALAEMIQAETGGELFSIRTDVVYPADGGELIDYAAEEQDEDARPELTSHIENLDDYDVIFVGYPNWWGDMPQALYSFFDEYDFAGQDDHSV